MKKIVAVVLCLALMLSMAGCHMFITNEEKDMNQVVATVFGENILKKEVIDLYDSYFSGYQLDDETKQYYLSSILDSLVETKVQEMKVSTMDITLTEEELAEIDADIEKTLKNAEESARKSFEEQAKTDETIDVDAKVAEYMEKVKEEAGINSGEYREGMIAQAKIEKVYNDTVKDITVTEDETKTKYDSLLETQKAQLDENPGATVDGTQVYNAPGRRYIKQILIMIPEATRTEIAAMADGTEKQAAQQAALDAIQSKADEVLKKAKNGEDFDALIAEYNEDTGMDKEGYIVYKGNTTYVTEFTDGAMALEKIGDISGLVASDYGYHILKYAGDAPSGAIAYDTVKDKIKEALLSEKKSAAWTEVTDGWYEEANVQKYADRLY